MSKLNESSNDKSVYGLNSTFINDTNLLKFIVKLAISDFKKGNKDSILYFMFSNFLDLSVESEYLRRFNTSSKMQFRFEGTTIGINRYNRDYYILSVIVRSLLLDSIIYSNSKTYSEFLDMMVESLSRYFPCILSRFLSKIESQVNFPYLNNQEDIVCNGGIGELNHNINDDYIINSFVNVYTIFLLCRNSLISDTVTFKRLMEFKLVNNFLRLLKKSEFIKQVIYTSTGGK